MIFHQHFSKENKYYNSHKYFFLSKLEKNKIKYIYFIGREKHRMDFFSELSHENKCIVLKKINELLTEFNVSKCKVIL